MRALGGCGADWGGAKVALASSDGQATFAGRTANKFALAIDGATRMRLAWLTSLVVLSSFASSRIGPSRVRSFAALLQLTSEQLCARMRGVIVGSHVLVALAWRPALAWPRALLESPVEVLSAQAVLKGAGGGCMFTKGFFRHKVRTGGGEIGKRDL